MKHSKNFDKQKFDELNVNFAHMNNFVELSRGHEYGDILIIAVMVPHLQVCLEGSYW